MFYRNYIFIITVLLISLFLSWRLYFYYPNNQSPIDIKTISLHIPGFTSHDLPIDLDKFDALEIKTTSVLHRRYTASNHNHINLYIIYSEFNPKAVYPPEISYPEEEISILDKGKESIKIDDSVKLKVNWLLLDDGQSQEMVYYWFKVGNVYTTSYWKQQVLIAFNNMIGNRKGSALIQVSTDIFDSHQENAKKIIDNFAGLITPLLSEYLP